MEYRADKCSVGDGWEDAEMAAKLWNKHIVPVLGEEAYARDWAWEEFCSRGAGDDESLAEDLADDLREKLEEED